MNQFNSPFQLNQAADASANSSELAARVPVILSVDDEQDISELISLHLKKQGFDVVCAENAERMYAQLQAQSVDLVLLDIMMPGQDGLTLCRQLRERFPLLPVIMLTALGDDIDRIIGLEVGADDYISKPFNPRELSARIKAVLRRSQLVSKTVHMQSSNNEPSDCARNETCYSFADFRFNIERAELIKGSDQRIELTVGEFTLLKTLLESAPRVLSRDFLLDAIAGREAMPFDRAVDIQISRLRQKIEDNSKQPSLIKTVRGLGYSFSAPVRKG